MIEYDIQGGKGGDKKPHQPVETPNNLLSTAIAKVLIAVSEGEVAGRPTAKDIYLDGTPIENPDGSLNFAGVKWEWRSGAQVQDHIVGLPEVSTEYSVGVELTTLQPWSRLVTNTNLDAVRFTISTAAFLVQEENGDTNGVKVEFVSELSTDGGPFVEYEKYTIDGKTNAGYEKTYRINLPEATNNWTIRVRRLTSDNESGRIQDKIALKSFAEVLDVKQTYPNTALLYVEFDSQLFGGGSIPRISVKTKGRVVRVPSNYDPETRQYTGIWNGDFKFAWTNNPVWVYYDILTNDRFGLGARVTPQMVDKYSLYEVSQYCDVMVNKGDGSGDMEPRHTCNIYIQDQRDAWTVLRDIAGIFNGMTYWNGNQFVAFADKEEDISDIPLFSRANVANGRFDYQSADEKSIYTSALVSYDDPSDHYSTQVEATSEHSEILRFGGDRTTEISAIGCTSRGEAQRKGKYVLLTNLLDRQVNFRTGLMGMDERVFPGKVIHVLDPLLGGRPFTGRVKVATDTVITLDRDVNAKAGDILYVTLKNGTTQGRTVVGAVGNAVQVSTPYSEVIGVNMVWYLEAADLKSQLFRVTKVTSPADGVFDIDAVEYNESKYGAIDNGARLETRPISVVPAGGQVKPANVRVSSYNYVEQTLSVNVLNIAWDQTPNALTYEVQWRVNEGDWVTAGVTGATNLEIKGIYTGRYAARVRATNASGIKSLWAYSETTQLDGKAGKPPRLAALITSPMLFGIRLDWQFPDRATDTLRTEIMYSETGSFEQARKLGDYAYPTDSHELHGLKAGQQFWFWARLVDRTGNIGEWFPFEDETGIAGNAAVNTGGIYNDYFAGLISSSALDKQLYDRIELIDGPDTLPGSVNNRIKPVVERVETVDGRVDEANNRIEEVNTELTERIDQINSDIGEISGITERLDGIDQSIADTNDKIDNAVISLEEQIANFTDALVYNPESAYVRGDTVRLGQKLYQAIADVPVGATPPNTAYWKDIGELLEEANALALQVEQNRTDIVDLDGKTTAIASSLDVLQAAYREDDGVGDMDDAINDWRANAYIAEERIVRANEDEALAQRIITIQAQFADSQARIVSFEQAFANEQKATAERDSQIRASLINSNAEIVQNQMVIAEVDRAATERIDRLTSTVGTNTAAITELQKVVVDGNGAVVEQLNNLQAQVGKNTGDISTLTQVVINNNEALGQRIDSLVVRVGDNEGKISTIETTIANNESATARRFESLEATVGDNTGKITSLTQTVVDNNTATNQRIDTLTGRVGTNESTIKTIQETITTNESATASELERIRTDVAGNTSTIQTLSETVSTQNSANATRFESLETNVGTNTANISSLSQNVVDRDTATNSRIDSLTTEVGTNTSNITNLTKTVSDNAGTTATAIQSVNSRVDKEITDREGAVAAEKSAREAAVSSEATTRADADTALGTRIDTTNARVDDNEAFIQQVEEAQASLEAVVASITTTVEAVYALNRDDDGVGDQDDAINDWKNVAYYSDEVKVRSSEDEALAQRITTLGVQFNAETARLDGVIQEERTVRATQDGVLAQRIDLTIAKAQTANAALEASILSEASARANADQVIAERVEQTNASIVTERGIREAAIRSEEQARVNGDEAVSSRVDQLSASVDTEVGKLNTAVTTETNARIAGDNAISSRVDTIEAGLITDAQVKALVQTETNARVSADNALGERINQVQATAGSNSAAILETSNAVAGLDGRVSAAWTVKMELNAQNQYVAAGIGLGIENGPAGLQSQFLVRADRFAVVNGTNTTTSAPFVVSGGQVFINDALINKATITNAIIQNNLSSVTTVAWAGGLPATVLTFQGAGALVMRNPTRANSYMTLTPEVQEFFIDGVRRVRIGSWA